jgi:hypothetical protein
MVVDHTKAGALVVSPVLAIDFAAEAFAEDTAVIAHFDPAAGKLAIETIGTELKPGKAQVRLDLSQLSKELRVTYAHREDRGGEFNGTLIDMSAQPRPQLTGATDDGPAPFIIDDSTYVLVTENNQRAQRHQWSDLEYGDQLRVRYGRGRRAYLIDASRVTGEAPVDRVTGDRLTLQKVTRPLSVSAQARVEDVDGKEMKLTDLERDDRVAYRQNPASQEVWYVKRTAAAAPQLVVNHDSGQPLLPGDRIRLRASGTPKGEVVFEIVGVDADIAARELRDVPGTYESRYTVPRGIKVAEAKVQAHIRLPNGRSKTAVGEKPLRFAGVPGAATIPTAPTPTPAAGKPKAPVVNAPAAGDVVGDTLVVSGTTDPQTKVKIVIDYVVTKSIFKLAEGRLTEEEVEPDARGAFRSKEIKTEVRTLISGDTDYTITVTAVGKGGQESDPVTVSVRRPD